MHCPLKRTLHRVHPPSSLPLSLFPGFRSPRFSTDMSDRRKRGGPSNASPEVRLSKALSYTLRHGAEKEGLQLRPDGYARVTDLLAMPKFRSLKLDLPTLRELVTSSDKKRFALASDDDGTELIRATQGHSIAMTSEALQLTPLLPGTPEFPSRVVHGTFYGAYEDIVASGCLKRMGRNHMHFAEEGQFVQGQVISGMRKDAEVLIVVDAARAAAAGLKFWRSENGVILTEGNVDGELSLEYATKIEALKNNLGVLWEDGKVVNELPAHLRGRRLPRGKEHVAKRDGGKKAGKGRGKGEGNGATTAPSSKAADAQTDTQGVESNEQGVAAVTT